MREPCQTPRENQGGLGAPLGASTPLCSQCMPGGLSKGQRCSLLLL